MAFGGAGPLLASALARELAMARVMVPAGPGLVCAIGLLVADVRSDFSLTRIAGLDDLGSAGINATFAEIERRALEWFDREGVEPGERTLRRAIDMRYLGQSHEITVGVQERTFSDPDLATLVTAFRREHERVYGYAPEAPVQLVTFRVTALARVTAPPVAGARGGSGDLGAARLGTRRAHFAELGGFVECPIYDRERIPPGVDLEGPVILEQMDSTTVVLPGQVARGDEGGNLILAFLPPRHDAEDNGAAPAGRAGGRGTEGP